MYQVLSAYAPLKKVLMHRPGPEIELVTSETAANFNFSGPVNQGRFRRDYDRFLELLRKDDVEPILLGEILADDIEAQSYIRRRPNMLYTRDIAVMIGSGVVLMNMAIKGRKFDEWIVERALKKLNIPVLGRIEEPGILEGGGLQFFDEHTMMVGLCDRANETAINQLKKILFEKTTIDRVLMILTAEGEIHIDGLIMMLDAKLAIVYKPNLELYHSVLFTRQGAPRHIWLGDFLAENKVDLIEVSKEERERAATNYIVTAPRRVVGYDLNPRVNKEITKRGGAVKTFPGTELFKGRGGPHCMTCPLWRAS